jgi:hypothetical protein
VAAVPIASQSRIKKKPVGKLLQNITLLRHVEKK